MQKRENVGIVSTQIGALMGWRVGSAVWFPAKLVASLAIADPEWAVTAPAVAKEILANPSYFGASAKGELVAVGDSWEDNPSIGPIRYAVFLSMKASVEGSSIEVAAIRAVDPEWLGKANRSKDILIDGFKRASKWLDPVLVE